ncbi:MAG TPA: beta-galactosidase GalA [bacterium]|nr:beta-galactosidase GalA [bacterium]
MGTFRRVFHIVSLFILAQGMALGAVPDPGPSGTSWERLSMDRGWHFALGNAVDPDKDFGFGKAYFSYFAKAGLADGPADPKFDDRAWRVVDLPHDWAAELPFTDQGECFSHGYKAIGRMFPQNSVGWYRRTFQVGKDEKGKRFVLKFDGVFRDSIVFVNGFYMGREQSGYNGFRYDITDYLLYGEKNTVSVRVDASKEEGWFYEGAGIYRHVWLIKTSPLHVAPDGVFVTSALGAGGAQVTVQTTLSQEGEAGQGPVQVAQILLDPRGKALTGAKTTVAALPLNGSSTNVLKMQVPKPWLWSPEEPSLYRCVTSLIVKGKVVDQVETPFGIRTLRWDANKGFFLNGKRVELKGTSDHQDHAGVGVALPDALQDFRIKQLRSFGCNAYRCSHNPPTPELLEACDRLGMLVLSENRLMGTTPELLDRFRRQVLSERNHPCIFAWSLGNEEWGMEGNDRGVQITASLQPRIQALDPTRLVTAAISGGWGNGTSIPIELMGYNYIDHGNTDDFHAKYPQKPSFGTEDSTTHQTRGVYDDATYGREGPSDRKDPKDGIERIWKYYEARPYLGGLFLWTGFDYRGEESPFHYPAVSSQYGILDTCGFWKDCADYLRCWWDPAPALFLTPDWQKKGKEGKPVTVFAYSNCDEVELFLNGKSLGKKRMEKDSHLEWAVAYAPGTLSAKGSKGGKVVAETKRETSGAPARLALVNDQEFLRADGEDVAVVTVKALDSQGLEVPDASDLVQFTVKGPGRLLGVGNGDPISHEADRYFDTVSQVPIQDLRMKDGPFSGDGPVGAGDGGSGWPKLFSGREDDQGKVTKDIPKDRVVRGHFDLPDLSSYSQIVLYPKALVDGQKVFVNGHLVMEGIKRDDRSAAVTLDPGILQPGRNSYAVMGKELLRRWEWEELNLDPGALRVVVPAPAWKRHLFNGLAQVLVQSGEEPGEIELEASAPGLTPAVLKWPVQVVKKSPRVP